MREHGEAVRVVVPQVATYLWRVRLHEPFQDDQNVTFEPNIKLFAFSRWFRPEEVLELTAINVADDDEVVAAERSLWGIIKARAPQFIPLGEQIRTALVELISNVERHSQTGRATVIAQTHRDCVRLAVGDVGIGVRQSLAGAYDLRVRSDHEVL
jgi:signal transduction histidine kinase